MDITKSGYCRDSDILTIPDTDVPTDKLFVIQSVLCPTSGDNIGNANVCDDTFKPALKGKTIVLTYGIGDAASTITDATVDSNADYTGEVLKADVDVEKTLINNILGDYTTVCEANSKTGKRVPRGSYLKATKTDNTETVYISDKYYIKTTKAGVTLIYSIVKTYKADVGNQYTIISIDSSNSGTCTDNKWTKCTGDSTSPCNAQKPTSPITIKLETSGYTGMTGYDIVSSKQVDFDTIFSHNNCLIKDIKLAKGNSIIYVTKLAESSNKVKVLVVDGADHIRVYDGISVVTGVQTITVGDMDITKSGYCRDSVIPTADNKEIPPNALSFVTQSILCKANDFISTNDVCKDTIEPALKGKTIEITYGGNGGAITGVKVDTDIDYNGIEAKDDIIAEILSDYATVCDSKKRIPRGSYLQATKKVDGEIIYISDKNYIKTTKDGITLVYEISKSYLSEGSKYTIGNIVFADSGKCTNNAWTKCESSTTSPCNAEKPSDITIKLDNNVYSSTELTDYTIISSNLEEFTKKYSHSECKKQTTKVPKDTIMKYETDSGITVYLSDNTAVKEKGDEFLVYEVSKTAYPSPDIPTGSKYEFTYKSDLSGNCSDNTISKCTETSATGLCSSTEFPEIIVQYSEGENPSVSISGITGVTILTISTKPTESDIKTKLEKYKSGKTCESDVISFEGKLIPDQFVMKHAISDEEYYIYTSKNIFYRKDQKQICIISKKEDKSNYTEYKSENKLDRKNCGYFSDKEGNINSEEDYNCVGIPKDSFVSIDWLKNNCDFVEENITKVFNVSQLELESTFVSNGTDENSEVFLYTVEGNVIGNKYGKLVKKESTGIYDDISIRTTIPTLLIILIFSLLF